MNKNKELAKRLRELAAELQNLYLMKISANLLLEAAAEIERLQAPAANEKRGPGETADSMFDLGLEAEAEKRRKDPQA